MPLLKQHGNNPFPSDSHISVHRLYIGIEILDNRVSLRTKSISTPFTKEPKLQTRVKLSPQSVTDSVV